MGGRVGIAGLGLGGAGLALGLTWSAAMAAAQTDPSPADTTRATAFQTGAAPAGAQPTELKEPEIKAHAAKSTEARTSEAGDSGTKEVVAPVPAPPGQATAPRDETPASAEVAVVAPPSPPIQATPPAAEPDPLTPPRVEEGPLRAPGAPDASMPPSQAGIAADPAIAILLDRLAAAPANATTSQREDRAALAAAYGQNGGQPLWTSPAGTLPRGTQVLAELRQADAYGLNARTFDLPTDEASAAGGAATTPDAQAERELKIGLAALTYARHARGGRVDPASLSRMIDMRPRPYEPKSVIEALAAADDAGARLRGFHPQHAGFHNLVAALAAQRAQPTGHDAVQRILVNMERWRWMPDDLGATHVLNNVPEQLTRVFKGGEQVLVERIVVGKPNSPTPLFSADMKFVIFHPSWGVPEGIKGNELGPMLRRASANGGSWFFGEGSDGASRALARHKLRVYHNGREVNPDNIDWTSANVRAYSFTQPPSGSNVLGVVKFRFPNRHDVYMHDTPERHLFAGNTRAFSHGCMRVQNPLKLAEVLLANDKGWSADKVHGFVARGSTSDIALDTPVPVHNVYFTASADAAGKLHLHGDVYGQDQRLASALGGRLVPLAAQPVAATSTVRAPVARRTASRGGAPATTSSISYNPFAGLFSN